MSYWKSCFVKFHQVGGYKSKQSSFLQGSQNHLAVPSRVGKFLARWIIKGQVALILYSWRRSSNPNSSERTPWIIDCSNYVVFFLAKKIMSSFFFWKKLYWLCLYTIYCISDLVVDRLSRNSFKGKTLLRVQVTYLPCKAIILFGLRIWPFIISFFLNHIRHYLPGHLSK